MSFLPFGFIYVWELKYTKPENPRTQKEGVGCGKPGRGRAGFLVLMMSLRGALW